MNDYKLGCSVEHHFRTVKQPTDSEYEENERQRLLKFSKDERSLWCWVCGFMLDPCDFRTPKEGVEAFKHHMNECKKGWREASFGDES